jgi:pimeloyl-ACP methyl ester carboxylesterase
MTDRANETPLFFDVAGDHCFGVLTHPESPNGVGVMIIQGGDTVNVSMQRNRLAVRMARMLAERGYTALRFDYHGLGESTGEIGELKLTEPFSEDAIAAAEELRKAGAGHIVMVGACFSARTALAAGPHLPDVSAVVASTPPIAAYGRSDAVAERMARDQKLGDYASLAFRAKTVRALFDPTRRSLYIKFARSKFRQISRRLTGGEKGERKWWVSPEFLRQLENLADREVPVLLAYGDEDPLLREFDRARDGKLGRIIADSSVIDVQRDLPGVIHGFPTIPGQEAFLTSTIDWIERVTQSVDSR